MQCEHAGREGLVDLRGIVFTNPTPTQYYYRVKVIEWLSLAKDWLRVKTIEDPCGRRLDVRPKDVV